MAERFDARWQMVTCATCGTPYQCTPRSDYYNATNDHDGVCESCLLYPHGLTPKDVQTFHVADDQAGAP